KVIPAKELHRGRRDPRSACFHATHHHGAVRRHVEEFSSIARPERHTAATRGYLPSPGSDLGERTHVDLEAARLVGLVRQPLTTGGYFPVPFGKGCLDEWRRCVQLLRRCRADAQAPEIHSGAWNDISKDDFSAVRNDRSWNPAICALRQ